MDIVPISKYHHRYDKKQLIALLQATAQTLGHTPTRNYMGSKNGLPAGATYRAYFGSWGKALETAGFHSSRGSTFFRKSSNIRKSTISLLAKEQRAYLAGAIDGEGSIFTYPKSHALVMTLVQTNKTWLENIQKMVGGGTIGSYKFNSRTLHNKPCWVLRFRTNETVDILRQILDYLYIKKTKALEALTIIDLQPYQAVI